MVKSKQEIWKRHSVFLSGHELNHYSGIFWGKESGYNEDGSELLFSLTAAFYKKEIKMKTHQKRTGKVGTE